MKKKILFLSIILFFSITIIEMISGFERYEIIGENLSNEGLVNYRNDDMGFEISILSDMVLDNSLNVIATNLSNEKISISVFYDDFTNDLNSYDTYIDYANNFLKDDINHSLIEDKMI